MKIIYSKKCKPKNKSKKKLRKYWEALEPKGYVKVLTSSNLVIDNGMCRKIASKGLDDVEFYGKLKRTKDGFVYVDVSNRIIDALYGMLNEKNIQKPPYGNKSYNSVGAHISVLNSEESDTIEDFDEIGSDIPFYMGDVYSTEPEGWDEMERVWFIQVDSEELENIRQKYGFSKKLNGHEFHITFAIRRKSGK